MNPKASFNDLIDANRDRSLRFAVLAGYYRKRYKALDASGEVPYRLTQLGAWATSRAPHLYHFFRTIRLDRYRLFVDLGSGDGVATCIAGLFTQAVGIEVDPELCGTSMKAARELELKDTVSFICSDYMTQRIVVAECLYMYPDKPIDRIESLLAGADWNGDLVIYGPHIPLCRMVPVHRLKCGMERLTLYRNHP